MDQDMVLEDPPLLKWARNGALQPPTRLPSLSYAAAVVPADEQLAAALSKLRLLVIRRDEEPVNEAAQNLAYIELLLEFPLEIVLEAIDRWPRKSKFWPAWKELHEAIEEVQDGSEPPKIGRGKGNVGAFVEAGIGLLRALSKSRGFEAWDEATFRIQLQKIFQGEDVVLGVQSGPNWTEDEVFARLPEFDGSAGEPRNRASKGT